MIQIILLIVGIVYAVRRPKYANANAASFPNVDPARFEEWRKLELKSIDIFLWSTWGTFALSLLLGFGLGLILGATGQAAGAQSHPLVIGLEVVMTVLFFGGLVFAAIAGSQATKLRKELGITI